MTACFHASLPTSWGHCQVPIQFEFQIVVTKAHPHFRVYPLQGIVPANAAVEVTPQNPSGVPREGDSAESSQS